MSRPPALTPAQQDEVRARIAAGEGKRALAREYKVGIATISRLSEQSDRVRNAAETMAAAQIAIAALPLNQQHLALSLAEKLRSISTSLASGAELGAKTAHRLQAIANTQVAKVDDENPEASATTLQVIGVLTKLANESAASAHSLLSANKGNMPADPPPKPAFDPAKLSNQTLTELLAARGNH